MFKNDRQFHGSIFTKNCKFGLDKLRHLLNQSDTKLKSLVPGLHTISCVWDTLLIFTSSSHQLLIFGSSHWLLIRFLWVWFFDTGLKCTLSVIPLRVILTTLYCVCTCKACVISCHEARSAVLFNIVMTVQIGEEQVNTVSKRNWQVKRITILFELGFDLRFPPNSCFINTFQLYWKCRKILR